MTGLVRIQVDGQMAVRIMQERSQILIDARGMVSKGLPHEISRMVARQRACEVEQSAVGLGVAEDLGAGHFARAVDEYIGDEVVLDGSGHQTCLPGVTDNARVGVRDRPGQNGHQESCTLAVARPKIL
ncbi:hypothetical protein, partial [Nocardia sp. NPDC004722]